MNVCGGFLAPRNIQIAAARCARPDEDRVPILGQQRFETVDASATGKLNAEVENIIAFLVDDGFRQAESRDLRADHAAGLRILIEHNAMIAKWSEVARDCQRCRSTAHKRNAPAVLDCRRPGQAVADVVLEVRGDALEATDRDWFLFHAAAPAGRLARPIASTPEDAGKYVGFPIDHVGVAVTACRDQSDIFRNRRVSRTGPLTIHHLVEIVRRRNVGGFHLLLCTHASRATKLSCANPRRLVSGAPALRAGSESGADTSGPPLEIPPIRSS